MSSGHSKSKQILYICEFKFKEWVGTLWWVQLSRSSAHALGAVTVKPQVDDTIVMIMITWHNITTTRIVLNIFFSFNFKV